MAEYEFLTTWCLDAPVERVFASLDDCAGWPRWWKGVLRADMLEPGDAAGIGRVWDYTFRSRLPYALSFRIRVTRRQPPYLMEGTAEGELIGLGRWRIFEGPATAVGARVPLLHSAIDAREAGRRDERHPATGTRRRRPCRRPGTPRGPTAA